MENSTAPWRISTKLYKDSMQDQVCTVQTEQHAFDIVQVPALPKAVAEANLKLIVAAPDLLQELRNIADAKPDTWDDPSDFRAWAQSRARHAISKLLG